MAVARELLSRVEGTAQNLECNGKEARISVRTDRGIMKFDILDPERITIRHASDTTHDFTCGPQQNYRIAIEYLPAPDSAKGVSGVARALEF